MDGTGLPIFIYRRPARGNTTMLETIAILLLILWLLGYLSAYTLGGFIHLLLVFAIIAVLIRIIQGQRPW